MTKRLLYLNGLAILGTVLNHTASWGLIALILWTNRYRPVEVPNYEQVGDISYYVVRALGQFIIYTIPVFIFVSGYFVAFATGRDRNTIPWKQVLTRIKFLLIPYLFWCLVAIFSLFLEGKVYSPQTYLRWILIGKLKEPYYFIPLLIQLYLLSPFLVPLAKSRWKLLLFISAIVQLLTQLTYYVLVLDLAIPLLPAGFQIPGWVFLGRIFWFSLGIVTGLHIQQFKEWFIKIRWLSLSLAIFFFIIGFIEWELIFEHTHVLEGIESVIDSLYALSFLLAFFGFASVSLPLPKQFHELGKNSYGIYLVHVFAQEYPARIIYHFAPWILSVQSLFLPIMFIAGLFGPLLLMEVVRRSPASRYYQYIFG